MQRFILPFAFSLATACTYAAPAGDAPLRSPAVDYPHPDVTTADGHALGADETRIEDKLHTSPRVGSEGFTPAQVPPSMERAPQPPLKVEPRAEDPICDVFAIRSSVRRQRCPPLP